MKLGGLLLIGRFKKKKRGRKKKGEFSFWETNLGLEGLSYKMGEQKNEMRRRFFLEQHALEDFLRRSTAEARRGKRNDCSQDHPDF